MKPNDKGLIDLLGSNKQVPPMLPTEGYEEVKTGTNIKILTPEKLLTRLPVLLAQTKACSDSYKIKHEIR